MIAMATSPHTSALSSYRLRKRRADLAETGSQTYTNKCHKPIGRDAKWRRGVRFILDTGPSWICESTCRVLLRFALKTDLPVKSPALVAAVLI